MRCSHPYLKRVPTRRPAGRLWYPWFCVFGTLGHAPCIPDNLASLEPRAHPFLFWPPAMSSTDLVFLKTFCAVNIIDCRNSALVCQESNTHLNSGGRQIFNDLKLCNTLVFVVLFLFPMSLKHVGGETIKHSETCRTPARGKSLSAGASRREHEGYCLAGVIWSRTHAWKIPDFLLFHSENEPYFSRFLYTFFCVSFCFSLFSLHLLSPFYSPCLLWETVIFTYKTWHFYFSLFMGFFFNWTLLFWVCIRGGAGYAERAKHSHNRENEKVWVDLPPSIPSTLSTRG